MEFCVELCQEFKDFSNDGEGFLTNSESQRIILNALENMKPYEDGTVPGYSDIKLFRNRAIGTSLFVGFIS